MSQYITVYTDGCCKGNNSKNSTNRHAGIGIFFEKNIYNLKSLSQSLTLEHKTNNRAELMAIITCIDMILKRIEYEHDNIVLTIKTDSIYCYNIITDWIYKWKKKNFENIKNTDLVKQLYELIKRCNLDDDLTIKFEYVAAHKKEPELGTEEWNDWYGNYFADKLANRGALKTKNK